MKKSDLSTLVWYPAIFVVLDEAGYNELNEAISQLSASSLKQFFPSSSLEDEEIERKSHESSAILINEKRVKGNRRR